MKERFRNFILGGMMAAGLGGNVGSAEKSEEISIDPKPTSVSKKESSPETIADGGDTADRVHANRHVADVSDSVQSKSEKKEHSFDPALVNAFENLFSGIQFAEENDDSLFQRIQMGDHYIVKGTFKDAPHALRKWIYTQDDGFQITRDILKIWKQEDGDYLLITSISEMSGKTMKEHEFSISCDEGTLEEAIAEFTKLDELFSKDDSAFSSLKRDKTTEDLITLRDFYQEELSKLEAAKRVKWKFLPNNEEIQGLIEHYIRSVSQSLLYTEKILSGQEE